MAKRKNNHFYVPLIILSILFLVTSYFLLFSPVPLFQHLRLQYSLSAGERYYGRVRLWYYYAQVDNWNRAVSLEAGIDPADISQYRDVFYPPMMKKRLNSLAIKNPKSPDDLIELAKIQASLGKFSEAVLSTTRANTLDPIRSDLEKIYYQILP